jgi:hypothetical protein
MIVNKAKGANTRNAPGKLARIGTNMLVTCDIDLVTRMNAPRSPYKRSDWYLGFRLAPGIDNVGSLRHEKEHTKRRAQMSPGVCNPLQETKACHLRAKLVSYHSIVEETALTSSLRSISMCRISSASSAPSISLLQPRRMSWT